MGLFKRATSKFGIVRNEALLLRNKVGHLHENDFTRRWIEAVGLSLYGTFNMYLWKQIPIHPEDPFIKFQPYITKERAKEIIKLLNTLFLVTSLNNKTLMGKPKRDVDTFKDHLYFTLGYVEEDIIIVDELDDLFNDPNTALFNFRFYDYLVTKGFGIPPDKDIFAITSLQIVCLSMYKLFISSLARSK